MRPVRRTIESLQEGLALLEETRGVLHRLPTDEWLKTLGGEIGMWARTFREGIDWLAKCETAIERSLNTARDTKEVPE